VIRLIVIALVAGALGSFAPRAARAQEAATAEPRRLSGGLLLGANFSDYGGSEDVEVALGTAMFGAETELATGDKFAAGGFVSYAWNRLWSLRIDALLSMKGARATGALELEGAPQAIPFAVHHTMRYVQVPVMVQRIIPYDGHIVPRVYAGPSIGVMLSSRVEGETVVADAMGDVSTISAESAIEDVSGRVDLGAMIGAGIGFPAWRGRLLVEARYEMFVTKAVDGRYTIPIGEALAPGVEVFMNARSLRNRGVSLLIGFEL
jgi:hypothetical protein